MVGKRQKSHKQRLRLILLKCINIQHVEKLPFFREKKLLAVGKGPTSDLWQHDFLNKYNTIGINHVASKFNTFIGHFTDYEMFRDQSEYSQFVICPAFMNYECKTTKDLRCLIQDDDKMRFLYNEKRLFSYDITTPDGFTTNLFRKKYVPFLFKYASGVLLVQLAIFWKFEEVFT